MTSLLKILYVLGQANLAGGEYHAIVNIILGLLENGAHVSLLIPRHYKDDARLQEIKQMGGDLIFYSWHTGGDGCLHDDGNRDCGPDPLQHMMTDAEIRANAYTDKHMAPYHKIRLSRHALGIIGSTDAHIVVLPTIMGRIAGDLKKMGTKVVVHDHGDFALSFYSVLERCALELVFGDSVVHADLILVTSKWHENNTRQFVRGRKHMQFTVDDPVTADTLLLVPKREDIVPSRFPKGHHEPEPAKIRHIHNPFVPYGDGSGITRKNLGIPDESFVFVYSGRLVSSKRIDITLTAYANFLASTGGASPSSSPNAALLLVLGDGPEYGNLKKQAGDLGISDRVVFAGRVRSPHHYLAVSDVFITTTVVEYFSMSVGEAYMAGIPVIAPRICSLPEIVIDGRTGLLYEPGDGEGLVGCMRRMYGSPGECRQMGSDGRRHVLENFAPGVIGKKMLDLYARCGLLEGAGRGGDNDDDCDGEACARP